jgi:hypothetical protein
MIRSRKTLWWRVAIGMATLPLLSTSCVEIAERAIINGFFDATTPLLDDQLAECLAQALEGEAEP